MKFDLDSSSWIVEVKEVMALIPEFTRPEFTHYGYELCKKGSIAFKQDFLKCACAFHNFLHSYDPV